MGGKIGALTAALNEVGPKAQKMLQGVYRGYAGSAEMPEQVFAANQRQLAEYYAARRAAQTGEAPHVDMMLIDPEVGRQYRLHPPGAQDMSGVRKLSSDDVQGNTQLYADGGSIRATPEAHPAVAAVARWLKTGDDFARTNNPPVQMLSDFAGIPDIQKTLERIGYGEPLMSGSGMTSRMRPETEGAALSAPQFLPAVGALSRLAGKGAAKAGMAAEKALTPLVDRVMANNGRGAQLLTDLTQGTGANVIKQKGGNWLSGSVEDTLKNLKLRIETPADATPRLPWTEQDELENVPRHALNSWIDKQLTRYVKNDMGTVEDPIRALAEKGPIHKDFGFDARAGWNPTHARTDAGFPAEGMGKSEQAIGWERASDRNISPNPARLFLHTKNGETGIPTVERNPWLTKLDPNATVYDLDSHAAPTSFGFDHLMDELRNAMDPASGLPPHLLLDHSKLDRVSVPQAVQRVAKINDWRAEQKVIADQAKANNAATVLHKDYPDKGFKWVELKKQDQLPEGWSEEFVDTGLGKLRKLRDPKTGGLTATDPREEALRDALKYEGDTMGHCVGGYCDDVANGNSNIFSLRDAKGQPHVTIEVKPGGKVNDPAFEAGIDFQGQAIEDVRRTHPHIDDESDDFMDLANNRMQELGAEWNAKQPPRGEAPSRIVQIKGKGNKKPNDEYLPFVQDFVKSGKWSDVGDLQNSGLRKTGDAFNDLELKAIREAGFDPNQYHTPEELSDMSMKTWPKSPPDAHEYAQGGSVPTKFADGGSVARAIEERKSAMGMDHSNNIMKQIVRGWAAGTLGMPGDLEGLARHLIPGVSNDSFLPTSDFYKEWLPGASEDPRLQFAADIGSWGGGMGVGKLATMGKSVVKPLLTKAGLLGAGVAAPVLAVPAYKSGGYIDGKLVKYFDEGGGSGGDGGGMGGGSGLSGSLGGGMGVGTTGGTGLSGSLGGGMGVGTTGTGHGGNGGLGGGSGGYGGFGGGYGGSGGSSLSGDYGGLPANYSLTTGVPEGLHPSMSADPGLSLTGPSNLSIPGLSMSPSWNAQNPATSLGNTGLGGGTTGQQDSHYSPDVTYGMLKALQNQGFGSEDAPGNPGQTVDQALATKTVGNIVNRAGMLALSAVPGAGMLMTGAKAINAMDGGMSLSDALANSFSDIGTGLISSKLNKSIMSGLSPDAAKAVANWNLGSSAANLFGAGIPGFNPGSMAVNALTRSAGVDGFGSGSIPGATSVSGSSIPDVQPWHGGSSTQFPDSLPQPLPPGNNGPSPVTASYDPMALQGHKLRVYDPVFK